MARLPPAEGSFQCVINGLAVYIADHHDGPVVRVEGLLIEIEQTLAAEAGNALQCAVGRPP